ncbi:ribonuclease T1 [Neolentinus lepideus HHB14362 ss-1]|uniref:Ribonuclease T1 n=1 Tax=Neolentinus lepideus HHB14362 ss-1 TaxID=1314782 RepID=A0A165W6Q6_9AGAM|nr:ribonuclease T1 [Neolentinus lepideus HHB14362 ss-1]
MFVLVLVSGTQALVAKRQSQGCQCGSNSYSADDISNAIDAAEDGGASDYPHQYKDYEGFSFSCSGTFYEYPLERHSTYDGGSPGADRVIYNDDGDFCACLTHTGASNDDFKECSF